VPARYVPHPEDIAKAVEAATMLDIRLTDARYYLHSNSKMNKRLVALVHMARDIRNELDRIATDVAPSEETQS
jgi:hypothetical protein